MSASPPLPDCWDRIIRPLEDILAGRGSRTAEPARRLLTALLFCFLFWRLRRHAGMAADRGVLSPQARRPAARKPAARHDTPEAGAAAQAGPAALGPDLPPPDSPAPPAEETRTVPVYGDALVRLMQLPEIRALLEATPQLKASLMRLLELLGAKVPPALAAARGRQRPPPPDTPRTSALKRAARGHGAHGRAANEQAGLGRVSTAGIGGRRLARQARDGPRSRSKGAGPRRITHVHFVTIF